MKLNNVLEKTTKYFLIFLSILFFVQAIAQYSIIPTEKILDFLGIGNGSLQIVLAILYLAVIIVIVSIILSYLNRKNIVKGLTKNTIILNLIVKAFMAFIIFFPAWISFLFLGGWGVFGEEIKIGIEQKANYLDIDRVCFLNFYLGWYFLINAFIKPGIAPEFGITKDEEDGVI